MVVVLVVFVVVVVVMVVVVVAIISINSEKCDVVLQSRPLFVTGITACLKKLFT
jgi:hypothetical protein